MIALAMYNNNSYDLDFNRITFAEVYEKWSEEKFHKISASNVYGHKLPYVKGKALHGLRFKRFVEAIDKI